MQLFKLINLEKLTKILKIVLILFILLIAMPGAFERIYELLSDGEKPGVLLIFISFAVMRLTVYGIACIFVWKSKISFLRLVLCTAVIALVSVVPVGLVSVEWLDVLEGMKYTNIYREWSIEDVVLHGMFNGRYMNSLLEFQLVQTVLLTFTLASIKYTWREIKRNILAFSILVLISPMMILGVLSPSLVSLLLNITFAFVVTFRKSDIITARRNIAIACGLCTALLLVGSQLFSSLELNNRGMNRIVEVLAGPVSYVSNTVQTNEEEHIRYPGIYNMMCTIGNYEYATDYRVLSPVVQYNDRRGKTEPFNFDVEMSVEEYIKYRSEFVHDSLKLLKRNKQSYFEYIKGTTFGSTLSNFNTVLGNREDSSITEIGGYRQRLEEYNTTNTADRIEKLRDGRLLSVFLPRSGDYTVEASTIISNKSFIDLLINNVLLCLLILTYTITCLFKKRKRLVLAGVGLLIYICISSFLIPYGYLQTTMPCAMILFFLVAMEVEKEVA